MFLFFGSVHSYWGSAKNSQFFATIPRLEMKGVPGRLETRTEIAAMAGGLTLRQKGPGVLYAFP